MNNPVSRVAGKSQFQTPSLQRYTAQSNIRKFSWYRIEVDKKDGFKGLAQLTGKDGDILTFKPALTDKPAFEVDTRNTGLKFAPQAL